ncbi:MAG: hypothetical protein KBD53_08690 [Candidatus Omnitrophica bacterium]|nr:hypothetical protein [Candidatus Omnitrophota bacterium]
MLKKLITGLTFLLTIILTTPVFAHVKWFSNFSFNDKPKTIPEILDVTFWGLMFLSVVAIGILVIIDYRSLSYQWSKKLTVWLEDHRNYSDIVMRAASAAVLLLSFQSGALFVPELKTGNDTLGWVQFALAVLLLFPKTVMISGFGMTGLYLYGMSSYGWFHMLDYAIFVGVGYYLIVHKLDNKKIRATGLILLYVTLGFSLAWLAIEKLIYPQWGLYVLQQNPQLAFGLNMHFFLTAAAFVEISLGYLMMICLLQRPLALVVTLVFFMTTIVFGKTEVIGHTILHAALIVFLLEGSGKVYPTPVEWYKSLFWRMAFACVNFVFFVFLLLWPYQNVAMNKYQTTAEKIRTEAGVEVNVSKAPTVELELIEDESSGYALHIKTKYFEFAPEQTGGEYVPGEGHVHIFIDNKKVGRAYGPWFYIEPQTKGPHQIKVTLNTNDHRLFLLDGKPIEAVMNFNVTTNTNVHKHH